MEDPIYLLSYTQMIADHARIEVCYFDIRLILDVIGLVCRGEDVLDSLATFFFCNE